MPRVGILRYFVPFLVLGAVIQSLIHSCLRGGRQDLQMIGVDGQWGFLVICECGVLSSSCGRVQRLMVLGCV